MPGSSEIPSDTLMYPSPGVPSSQTLTIPFFMKLVWHPVQLLDQFPPKSTVLAKEFEDMLMGNTISKLTDVLIQI